MTALQRRRAISVGLLLPGLLLTHSGGADADTRPATSPARKATSKTETSARKTTPKKDTSVERKVRSRVDPGPSRSQTVHVVRSGDSVSRIAARYHVTRKALIDANKLARPEQLRLGQRLVVPGIHIAAGRGSVEVIDAGIEHGDVLFVRAGPRRVPTKFYMAEPGFEGQAFDLAWPVEGQVISAFGRRRTGWHAGMDIKAEIGTPILAAAPGVVITSGHERSYGRIIRIEHDTGFVTVYAHNLENLVEVGDRVTSGTIIATVGRSGRTTTPHLHFEVRYEGIVYNPLHLLPARDLIELRPDEALDLPTESARVQVVDDDVHE